MSCIYLSQGFTIFPHRQVVERNGETIQVRPKTFALLLLLLEKPREVLSKSYLLDNVWDDVTVEEQVLVQSVRELRQLFGNAEVIQTYPRKGYAWAMAVDKQSAIHELTNNPEFQFPEKNADQNSLAESHSLGVASPDNDVTTRTTPTNTTRVWSRGKLIVSALALIVLFVAIGHSFLARSIPAQTEVVIVLPVKNQIPGNEYDWVPLGVMDQLIHLLVSDKSAQVMFSEYVFQIMKYAHLERHYESEQVPKLFEVSGATLIVESQLSGAVEAFRLDYKLRTRNDVKRGVIFDKDLNQAVYKLGEIIVSQTGQKLQDIDHNAQTSFANELMARGVEKMDKEDYQSAQNLFKSLIQLEPGNLIAREELVRSMLRLKQYDAAKQEINATLHLVSNEQFEVQARMYFLLGVAQMEQGDTEAALHSLDRSDELAAAGRELLIGSAAAGIRGRIHLERGDFSAAQSAFEKSLGYDKLIRCSIGQSDNHLNLAEIFLKQGKREQAQEHYNLAKKLIETHQLDAMKPRLQEFSFN